MDYPNRSGEIKVELTASDLSINLTAYIDGREIFTIGAVQVEKIQWKDLLTNTPVVIDALQCRADKLGVRVKGKMFSKLFHDEFRVTPAHFFKVVKLAMWSSVKYPYKRFLKFCTIYAVKPRGIAPRAFHRVVEMHDILEQMEADGQQNLIPVAIELGLPPNECRKVLGKGLWKKLCANTVSRNMLICNRQRTLRYYEDTQAALVENLVARAGYRSGALKFSNYRAAQWQARCGMSFAEQARGIRSYGMDIVTQRSIIFRDTMAMARTLNQPFSEMWSIRKMKDKHDEYSVAYSKHQREERKQSDAKFAKLFELDIANQFDFKSYSIEGVQATVLTTMDEVLDEGDRMHHCVGSYAQRVIEGHYCVVHLQSADLESTLGLTVRTSDGKPQYKFQQHYGRYNNIITEEAHRKAEKAVIDRLNGN